MSEKELHEAQTDEEELSDVVELIDDGGKSMKFYHIATMDHEGECFAFFQPAEEMEGVEEDEVVIFQISEDAEGKEVLLPVEDEAKLDAVYEEFCKAMEEDCDDDCDCGHCHGHCDCGCED